MLQLSSFISITIPIMIFNRNFDNLEELIQVLPKSQTSMNCGKLVCGGNDTMTTETYQP